VGGRGVITVIGLDGSPLAPDAAATLARASLVVGGRRHLAAVGPADGVRTVAVGDLRAGLDALAGHDGDAVVLASGDPGFFGIVRAMRARGVAFDVIPAVSSIALAFGRAGLAWDDAVVVSAHGRNPRQALNACRAYPKVAVLTGPGAGPAEIGAALAGWDKRLLVCELLAEPGERLTECEPEQAASRDWADPNVLLVLAAEEAAGGDEPGAGPGWMWPRPPAARAAPGWALPEDAFDSQGAVITKAEVRALALARLAPGPGALIWDVGAGTGSVGVECARFGAAVIAVERDEGRCALIRKNARRHQAGLRVVCGEAPGAFDGLPDPDAVFVGGGGPGVVADVAKRNPDRIVVALAAVERTGQAHAALAEAGYAVTGSLIQAARLAPLPGDAHRLAGTNPVFLLWAAAPDRAIRGAAR
jgi:precorrin-6B C5,15-methyltransferase / cobalt-precorrin-6B C5,C15-methyltransferase